MAHVGLWLHYGTVEGWNRKTGDCVYTFKEHVSYVYIDGTRMLSARTRML